MSMHQRFQSPGVTYFFLALAVRATSKYSVFVSDPLLKQSGLAKCYEASAIAIAIAIAEINF